MVSDFFTLRRPPAGGLTFRGDSPSEQTAEQQHYIRFLRSLDWLPIESTGCGGGDARVHLMPVHAL